MKQAQFITLMSESLGVEEKTIRMIVRILREAGLFTTGARGVNAPDITPLDAVRVVLAVVASPSPSRAVRDVKYFGALKPDMRGEDARPVRRLDENATLEETLLQCIENRFPYEAIDGGYIELSERGDAMLHFDNDWQRYHQREQWERFMAAKGEDEIASAADEWEAMTRISNTKVNRSAVFYLDALHQIGFEMTGWEVD